MTFVSRTAVLACSLMTVGVFVACSAVEAPVPPLPGTPALEVQGQIIANGLGACGHCHSAQGAPESSLTGGRLMADDYGDIQAPNITLAKAGIGSWSEGDLIRVFRAYVKPGGQVVSPRFHDGAEWMSDVDLAAITTYLRSVPPIENEVPKREVSWLVKRTVGYFDAKADVRGFVPQIPRNFKVEYGQYLVDHVAHCGSCHSVPEGIIFSARYMAGGEEISFDGRTKVAPNITASEESGLKAWSEADYKNFFASGQAPDGRQIDPAFCPIQYYRRAPSEDIDAMVAYLRTIPAD